MRFKLTIEYDGTRYGGWQLQKNARTIQGELLDAAFKVFETQNVEIYGAGRTDAGVHARGQVAHLEIPMPGETGLEKTRFAKSTAPKPKTPNILPDKIRQKLNDELPSDINILRVDPVHPRFHARQDVRYRRYIYQISKRRDAFGKKYYWWVKDPLDVGKMKMAAAELVGFHDFRSFGDTEKEGQSTLVELAQCEIREDAERIYIHLTGSHFLWKMVRRIVGCLVEVGRGKMSVDTFGNFLGTSSREPARFTAPPAGLFLEEIKY